MLGAELFQNVLGRADAQDVGALPVPLLVRFRGGVAPPLDDREVGSERDIRIAGTPGRAAHSRGKRLAPKLVPVSLGTKFGKL